MGEDWEAKYWDLYQKHQNLGFRYRETASELQRIVPLYEKFYNNPLFWLVRPIDPKIEGRRLMRCKSTSHGRRGSLFLENGKKEFTVHRGHLYGVCTDTSLWEYVKFRLALIR